MIREQREKCAEAGCRIQLQEEVNGEYVNVFIKHIVQDKDGVLFDQLTTSGAYHISAPAVAANDKRQAMVASFWHSVQERHKWL